MKVNIENGETGIFAIGGLGKIGKNTYGVQFQGEIIIIDTRIKFPENDLLGIDYVIPDYNYIIQNLHKVKALVIIHGHEDHTGGVPYLLRQASIPIYAGPLALVLITNKLGEHGLLREVELHEISEDTVIRFRKTTISFFRTAHNIPDALGVVVKTPSSNIVATGDFKFDFTPVGEPANLRRMARLGEEGVLCLLLDSTDAKISTFTKSEKAIETSILKAFRKIDGRIIFTSFASNIFRLQQATDTAVKAGRKTAVFGRSMGNAIVSGERLGYTKVPKRTFVGVAELNQLPADETMILYTGSQREPMTVLSRTVSGTHRQINIQPGNTIIFSSSPIPENTTSVNRLINLLSEADAEVIHGKTNNIYTSDHGGQEGQELVLRLMKPKYFMPIHGEFRMLKIHTSPARDTRIPEENCSIMSNGDVLALAADNARLASHFSTSDVYVDGNDVGNIGSVVLRDRRILSEGGLVLAVATVDVKNKGIMADPDTLSRSFIYMRESGDMIHEGQRLLFNALREAMKDKNCTETKLDEAMTTALQPFLFEQAEHHPVILPMIMTATINDQ